MRENTSMKTSRAARLASPLTAQRGGERSRVWWAEEDVSPQNVFRSEKNLCFLLDSTLVALGVDEAEPGLRLEDDGVRAERDMEYTSAALKLRIAAVQVDSQRIPRYLTVSALNCLVDVPTKNVSLYIFVDANDVVEPDCHEAVDHYRAHEPTKAALRPDRLAEVRINDVEPGEVHRSIPVLIPEFGRLGKVDHVLALLLREEKGDRDAVNVLEVERLRELLVGEHARQARSDFLRRLPLLDGRLRELRGRVAAAVVGVASIAKTHAA